MLVYRQVIIFNNPRSSVLEQIFSDHKKKKVRKRYDKQRNHKTFQQIYQIYLHLYLL